MAASFIRASVRDHDVHVHEGCRRQAGWDADPKRPNRFSWRRRVGGKLIDCAANGVPHSSYEGLSDSVAIFPVASPLVRSFFLLHPRDVLPPNQQKEHKGSHEQQSNEKTPSSSFSYPRPHISPSPRAGPRTGNRCAASVAFLPSHRTF